MTKLKKRKLAERRRMAEQIKATKLPFKGCPNCGECGPHFVPPGMGMKGFYFCKPNPEAFLHKSKS